MTIAEAKPGQIIQRGGYVWRVIAAEAIDGEKVRITVTQHTALSAQQASSHSQTVDVAASTEVELVN